MEQVVGVIGGGQLARMMIGSAIELGVGIRVLAETADSAAALGFHSVGDYQDLETVRHFASSVDVVTFDHEHVPQQILTILEAEGVLVRPGSQALRFAQDKLAMRERLTELGLPVPDWATVSTTAELGAFLARHDGRGVVKLPVGGYDGHGVRFVSDPSEVGDWLEPETISRFPQGLLVEEAVDFVRELSQLSARSPSGEFVAWPLAESWQDGGVCVEVVAPAPRAASRTITRAEQIARAVAEGVGVVGVLAVELFETADGRLLVNELAMRPHNTGHWTMDGSVTGQFEQHLRAVLDLPLGSTASTGAAAAMVNVLGGPEAARLPGARAAAMAADSAAKIHWYGKQYRPGRKVGHVNVVSNATVDAAVDARARARAVAGFLDAENVAD